MLGDEEDRLRRGGVADQAFQAIDRASMRRVTTDWPRIASAHRLN